MECDNLEIEHSFGFTYLCVTESIQGYQLFSPIDRKEVDSADCSITLTCIAVKNRHEKKVTEEKDRHVQDTICKALQ